MQADSSSENTTLQGGVPFFIDTDPVSAGCVQMPNEICLQMWWVSASKTLKQSSVISVRTEYTAPVVKAGRAETSSHKDPVPLTAVVFSHEWACLGNTS